VSRPSADNNTITVSSSKLRGMDRKGRKFYQRETFRAIAYFELESMYCVLCFLK
jgi:hypothetical protein